MMSNGAISEMDEEKKDKKRPKLLDKKKIKNDRNILACLPIIILCYAISERERSL